MSNNQIFIAAGRAITTVSDSDNSIFGSNATTDEVVKITDATATNIIVDANVERVQFTGAIADYKYLVVGTNLKIYNAAGTLLVSTIGVQADETAAQLADGAKLGTQLTFANGTVDAKITGLNAITIGDQAVSTTTAAAVTIPTAKIDASLASAPAAIFSVSAPITTVTEATGAVATFTVSLNAVQPAATNVTFALGNVGNALPTLDYGVAALATGTTATLAGSVITFPAGATTATITVPVVLDAIAETGEGVSLTLSAPSTGAALGTVSTAQVLIIDPPTPVFSLSAATTTVLEGNTTAGTLPLVITRTGNTAGTDTVVVQSASGTGANAATTSDFVAISQTVSFAPGVTTMPVTFTTVADTIRETDEVLTVSLGSPSTGATLSATSSVTLTITNDDANLIPVITAPTTTPSAFIGSTPTPITGISFTDADDNTGFSVTVTAAGSSQVSFTTVAAGSVIKNAVAAFMNVNEPANTIVISGSKDAVNATLATLNYTSNSTVPTTESVTVTVVDPVGGTTGTATRTLSVNIGQSGELRLSQSDSLVGSSGDDQFKLASTATFADLTTADTINGGLGRDKLTLTGVNSTVVGAISNVEILDLTLTGASTVTVTAANFGSSLDTINYTSGTSTLGATVNAGTTFNYAATATAPGALTVANVLVPSTSVASTVLTDAITVNLNGGVTLSSITDSAVTVDVLNINSNGTGTTVNVLTTLNNLAAAANVNIAGSQQLTIGTLPTTTGVISGAAATGKLILTAGASATTVIGGLSGDSITGGAGADSLSGGAGNDTISGGTSTTTNTITGGTGVDSLTGGSTGVDTFVFAPGDTGSTSTTRDTIVDLKENDVIKMGGYLISSLANAATLPTSASSTTTKEIYIDVTNKLLVIETAADGSTTEQINIPSSVANATFTYSYGADSIVGSADDYITVGAAPLTATNNALGKLTLTGKAIGTAQVIVSDINAPKLGGGAIGNNAVNVVDASNVTNAGIALTQADGATLNLSVTGSAQADTFTITQANTVTVTNLGYGVDVLNVNAAATVNATLYSTTPSWSPTVLTVLTAATAVTVTAAAGTTTATVDMSAVGTNGVTNLTIDASNASGLTTLKGTAGVNATHIKGGTGVDTITAGNGGGSITGGVGADVLIAAAGVDKFVTSVGDSNAVVVTGDANDTGSDNIYSFTAGAANDKILINVTSSDTTWDIGTHVLRGAAGGTTLVGAAASYVAGTYLVQAGDPATTSDGFDIAANVYTTAVGGANTAAFANDGAAQADTIVNLTGTAGNDTLTTGANNDTVNGLAGNDTITAGAGADTIDVGTGTDRVVIADADISATAGNAAAAVFAATGDIIKGLTNGAGPAGTTDTLGLTAVGPNLTIQTVADITAAGAISGVAGGVIYAGNAVAGNFVANGAVVSATVAASLALIVTAGAASNHATNNDAFVIIRDSATDGTADLAIFRVNHAAVGTAIVNTEVQFVGVLQDFGTTLTNGFIV